jgi:hypothetical protein
MYLDIEDVLRQNCGAVRINAAQGTEAKTRQTIVKSLSFRVLEVPGEVFVAQFGVVSTCGT